VCVNRKGVLGETVLGLLLLRWSWSTPDEEVEIKEKKEKRRAQGRAELVRELVKTAVREYDFDLEKKRDGRETERG
jgi:hypothetical protein